MLRCKNLLLRTCDYKYYNFSTLFECRYPFNGFFSFLYVPVRLHAENKCFMPQRYNTALYIMYFAAVCCHRIESSTSTHVCLYIMTWAPRVYMCNGVWYTMTLDGRRIDRNFCHVFAFNCGFGEISQRGFISKQKKKKTPESSNGLRTSYLIVRCLNNIV